MKLLFLCLMFAIQINSSAQTLIEPIWSETVPGVWKAVIGKPDKLNFYKIVDVEPKSNALKEMPPVTFPLTESEIKATIIEGKTYLRFPLEKQERIYGLGLNFKTVEQRGRIMRLHVDHYSGVDNGRTHAPVPFYISSKGYGVLINSARYIDIWVGTGVEKNSKNPPVVRDRNTDPEWEANPYSDNIEILIPTEGTEVLVFGGPSMLDVVRRYNLYNGGGCLPPKWGLGFWHRTPALYNSQQVLDEVKQFAEHQFPLTVIGLEPGWQSKSYPCTYEWDKNRFPDPVSFINTLKQKGVYVNNWINPYISPECELYNSILPYTASHTVWNGVVPDYSIPEAQNLIYSHFMKNILDHGVSGLKIDECDGFDEWLWPDIAQFPSGTSAEQMRQLYGLMMQKLMTEIFHRQNKRTYGLTRASNAGASSFPYVLYNDYYSHPDFITALINSSFIGVLWTPEVRSSETAEEWLRRMQTVCFSPIAMINAWADGTKPWSFPEVEKKVLDIAQLRIKLIPYIYTSFADYAFYGTPPIRAMNLEPGFSGKEIKDQFMFGDALLVAPLFTGQTTRQVVLPPGKWYDFYTGEFAGEAETINVIPEFSRIPVFVRDGGIVPMMPVVTSVGNEKLPLEIRVYGKIGSSYALYDDDGVSFDYEKGKFTRILLTVSKDKSGKLRGNVIVPESADVWSYDSYIWKFMTK